MRNFLIISVFISLLLFTEAFGLPPCHQDYQEWLDVGSPSSWTHSRQCRGDVEGNIQGYTFLGYWHVGTDDLAILAAAWKIKEPPYGPGIATIVIPSIPPGHHHGGIAADIDHRAAGSPYTGDYRVSPKDLNILFKYWEIRTTSSGGPGVDPNCMDCPLDPVIHGPQLSLRVDTGQGYFDTDRIELYIGQTMDIGITNTSTDKLKWYDAYVIMTDGLANGSWTGVNGLLDVDPGVDGWTYYGTSPLPLYDAWYAEISTPLPDDSIDPENVSAYVEYMHDTFDETTVTLFNEFYEPVDTLVIAAVDIHLYSPNGGEALFSGETHTIDWLAKPYITDIKIEYSVNNGTDWVLIESSTTNDGSYDWTVPFVQSTQCLIRVSDASVPATNDDSDAVFSIDVPPSLTVISPNGNENLVSSNST